MKTKKKRFDAKPLRSVGTDSVQLSEVLERSYVDAPPADGSITILLQRSDTGPVTGGGSCEKLGLGDLILRCDEVVGMDGRREDAALYKQIAEMQRWKAATRSEVESAISISSPALMSLLEELCIARDVFLRLVSSPGADNIRNCCLSILQVVQILHGNVAQKVNVCIQTPVEAVNELIHATVMHAYTHIVVKSDLHTEDTTQAYTHVLKDELHTSENTNAHTHIHKADSHSFNEDRAMRFVVTLALLLDLPDGRLTAAHNNAWRAPATHVISHCLCKFTHRAGLPPPTSPLWPSHPCLPDTLRAIPMLLVAPGSGGRANGDAVPGADIEVAVHDTGPALLAALGATCEVLLSPALDRDGAAKASMALIVMAIEYWRCMGMWVPTVIPSQAAGTVLRALEGIQSYAGLDPASQLVNRVAAQGTPHTVLNLTRAAVMGIESTVLTAFIDNTVIDNISTRASDAPGLSSTSTSEETLLCSVFGPTLLDMCDDVTPSTRTLALQSVAGWLPIIGRCISDSTTHPGGNDTWWRDAALTSTDGDSVRADCSVDLQSLLDRVMCVVMATWESPTRAAAAIVPQVFESYVVLQQVMMERLGVGVGVGNEWLPLVEQMLSQPAHLKGKYAALLTLLPHVGATRLLSLQPGVIRQLLKPMGEHNHVASQTLQLLVHILRGIAIDASSQLEVEVRTSPSAARHHWIPCMAPALLVPCAKARYRVADVSLEDLLQWDPDCVPELLNAIRLEKIHEDSDDGLSKDGIRLWALIEVVRRARDGKGAPTHNLPCIGKPGEGAGRKALLSYEEVRAAAVHYNSRLRIAALLLLTCNNGGASLPEAHEVDILKETLPYSLKTSDTDEQARLGRAIAVLSSRLRDTGLNLHKIVFRSGNVLRSGTESSSVRQNVLDLVTAEGNIAELELERAADLARWLCVTLLACLYPGSPFAREVLAADLLGSLATALAPPHPLSPALSAVLFQSPSAATMLVNLSISSWDRTRHLAHRLLARLPDATLDTRNLARWGLVMTRSPRQRESDAGALILRLLLRRATDTLTARTCNTTGLQHKSGKSEKTRSLKDNSVRKDTEISTDHETDINSMNGNGVHIVNNADTDSIPSVHDNGNICKSSVYNEGDSIVAILELQCAAREEAACVPGAAEDALIISQEEQRLADAATASGELSVSSGTRTYVLALCASLAARLTSVAGTFSAILVPPGSEKTSTSTPGSGKTLPSTSASQNIDNLSMAPLLLHDDIHTASSNMHANAVRNSLTTLEYSNIEPNATNDNDDKNSHATSIPLAHGVLAALAYAVCEVTWGDGQSEESLSAWRHAACRVLELAQRALALAVGIVAEEDGNNEDEESHTFVDCRGHRIVDDGHEREETRVIVVGSWLMVKEATNLIAVLISNVPPGMLSYEQVRSAGRQMLDALLIIKHNGALIASASSIHAVCASLLCSGVGRAPPSKIRSHGSNPSKGSSDTRRRAGVSPDPNLRHLPEEWLTVLLDKLQDNCEDYLVRRGGGLAAAFQAILRAEPQNRTPSLLPKAMKVLLGLAKDRSGEFWELKVNAQNVLRLIFNDCAMASDIVVYVEPMLLAAMEGFEHEKWQVRNSSMMVLAAIISRVVSNHKNTPTGDKVTSVQSFFERYPLLHPFLLTHLRKASEHHSSHTLHPLLHPILLLLSRLHSSVSSSSVSNSVESKSSSVIEDTHVNTVEQTQDNISISTDTIGISNTSIDAAASFVSLVIAVGDSPHHLIRAMSARALKSLVPPTQAGSTIISLMKGAVPVQGEEIVSHNKVHGTLLQVLELLGSIDPPKRSSVAPVVRERAWLASPANACPPIRTVMAQILKLVGITQEQSDYEPGNECDAPSLQEIPGMALWVGQSTEEWVRTRMETEIQAPCTTAEALSWMRRLLFSTDSDVRDSALRAIKKSLKRCAANTLSADLAFTSASLAAEALLSGTHPYNNYRALSKILSRAVEKSASAEEGAFTLRGLTLSAELWPLLCKIIHEGWGGDGAGAAALEFMGYCVRDSVPGAEEESWITLVETASQTTQPIRYRDAACTSLLASGALHPSTVTGTALRLWFVLTLLLQDDSMDVRTAAVSACARALHPDCDADAKGGEPLVTLKALEAAHKHMATIAKQGEGAVADAHRVLLLKLATEAGAGAVDVLKDEAAKGGGGASRVVFEPEELNLHAEGVLTVQYAALWLEPSLRECEELPENVLEGCRAALLQATEVARALPAACLASDWVGGVTANPAAFPAVFAAVTAGAVVVSSGSCESLPELLGARNAAIVSLQECGSLIHPHIKAAMEFMAGSGESGVSSFCFLTAGASTSF